MSRSAPASRPAPAHPSLALLHTPAARRLWVLALLAATLLPIWVGAYPPLFDYQGHLLEVRVARDFADPRLAYADGFVARPGWMADSNALFTLAAVGLSRFAPVDVAGQLALSLSLAIFLFGLRGLLRQAGTAGALLPLAPLLAYNFTFASGWLNFALATALGLCALRSYEGWAERGGWQGPAFLAVLAVLIYSAHLVVWGLLAVALGVRAAADRLPARRLAALAAAGAATLALTLPTRPALAAIVLIGPAAWLAARAVGRLRLPAPAVGLAAVELGAVAFLLGLVATPWLRQLDPEIAYRHFPRGTFLLRTFTLAQQLPTPDRLLSAANVILAGLLLALAALLAWGAVRAGDGAIWRRLAPLAAFAALYGAVPSFTGDIAVVEPRIVLWAGLVALAAVRLPEGGRLRRLIGGLALAAGLLATTAFTAHSLRYQEQAAIWRGALEQLAPARTVLVFPRAVPFRADIPLRYIESYYDGLYFSARYQQEHGGATTRMFGNGPVYVRPDLEAAEYLWRPAPGYPPLPEACEHTRARFDAALAWGPLEPDLSAALDACLGPGWPAGNLTIWRP